MKRVGGVGMCDAGDAIAGDDVISMLMVAAGAAAGPPVLQAGVTAPYGVMPGVRLGLRAPILGWDHRKRSAALVVGGDAASYVDPRDHVSGLAGAVIGVRWQRGGVFGFGVEAGLAAVADRQTLGVTVDLGSGALTRQREWRVWLLPTMAGRLLWHGSRRLGAYAALSVGPEFGFGRDGALVFTFDAGLRVRLGSGDLDESS